MANSTTQQITVEMLHKLTSTNASNKQRLSLRVRAHLDGHGVEDVRARAHERVQADGHEQHRQRVPATRRDCRATAHPQVQLFFIQSCISAATYSQLSVQRVLVSAAVRTPWRSRGGCVGATWSPPAAGSRASTPRASSS